MFYRAAARVSAASALGSFPKDREQDIPEAYFVCYTHKMTNEFNHEPYNYSCPFCLLIGGHNDEFATQDDIVYQNEFVTAKNSAKMVGE